MHILKKCFIALFISTINLTLASQNKPNYPYVTIKKFFQKQAKSINIPNIDNEKRFGIFVLLLTANLNLYKFLSKRKTSNNRNIHQVTSSKPHPIPTIENNHPNSSESSEQSDYEDSNQHKKNNNRKWLEYDSNKEGFKILKELFPAVALIQKINYEKALKSPLMQELLTTVRLKNNHYLIVHNGALINLWLRECGIFDNWPKHLTPLITDKIDVQKNPKLVYHDTNLVVFAQDKARDEDIIVKKRRKKNTIYINHYASGKYPTKEKNIVLIRDSIYKHKDHRKYVHVNYCTLFPNKAYEYDKGNKERERIIFY